MYLNHTVSVIVPVFNEEKTVGGVIGALLLSEIADEVICIDNASTDRTRIVLNSYRGKIIVISHKMNMGKSYSMAEGIQRASGEIIIFCDGDIIGLNNNHLETIVQPLISGEYQAVLAIPGGKTPGFENLTGERAYFKKDLTKLVHRFKNCGFGGEVFLNRQFPKKQTKMVKIGCIHIEKLEKSSSFKAFKSYIGEGVDLAREYARSNNWWNSETGSQINSLVKAKTWKQLAERIKEIGNNDVRGLVEKYMVKYSQKIQSYFK